MYTFLDKHNFKCCRSDQLDVYIETSYNMSKGGGLKCTIEFNACIPALLCLLFGKAANTETNNVCAGDLYGTLTYDATDKMDVVVVV